MSFSMLTLALLTLSACSIGGGGSDAGRSRTPVAAYCPYIASPKTYASPVTVTGSAFYEFRSNGNGPVSDSVHTITPSATTNGNTYSLTVSGTVISFTCDSAICSQTYAAGKIIAAVNASTASPVTATGTSTVIVTPKNEGDAITITSTTFVTDTPDTYAAPNNITHPDPNPIRFAEVQVTDSGGAIVQCTETTSTGSFSFQVPTGNYTVAVMSRSNNATNTAYILSDPYANTVYSVSATVNASGSPVVRLVAKVAAAGGAFNILDQIAKAQNFLRLQTSGCSSTYPDCDPFTIAPLVNVFWSPGVTPAIYSGGTNGISYYGSPDRSTAMLGLYVLGGIGGDTDNSDMDQFDNSVIVHEYGHFIEDNFGRMDSPGGSHNGNGIIDARLAWGEGWADFFQGAVLSYYSANNGIVACNGTTITCGNGFYRDTYGHVGCSGSNAQGLPGCTGASFNTDLSIDPSTLSNGSGDKPIAAGEGDFREFSIARIMYKAIRQGATPIALFNEIWTVVHGPARGMKVSTNRFKGIGQFHEYEVVLGGMSKWAALRSNELHYGDVGDYSTPFDSTSCASTNQAMSIRVQCTSSDDGSFSTSDQMRNNDFYRYSHPGGALALNLSWSGAGKADLDLYVYAQGYVFGSGWSAVSAARSNTTSGSESISTNLPAGNYLINVMAFTGKIDSDHANYPYTNPSCASPQTAATTYNLTINGAPLCPNYTKDSVR